MTHRSRKPSQPDDQTVVIGSSSWAALWANAALPVLESLRYEDGWRSALDEARRLGVARSTAELRLRSMAKQGILERRIGRGGRNVPTAFYRPLAPNGQAKLDSVRAR